MMGRRRAPTFSKSHRYGSGFQGSPVDARIRSDERSCARTCSVPWNKRARTTVGEIPITLTR
jgi:hypothetical protein